MDISPTLKAVCKRLKLSGILHTLPERIAYARQAKLTEQALMELIFQDEIDRREHGNLARRLTVAGFEQDDTLESFDWNAPLTFDRDRVRDLFSLAFLDHCQDVLFLGPVGVGKTFLANALGHLCCRAGFNVRLLRADALLRLLKQSRMDNSREAVMTQLAVVDVLVIDDFALEPMSREESRDIYQLFVERNARASTVVTSNRDTAEWIAAFDDALLAQSAVDRFKNNAFDLVVDGESYRSRLKPNIDKLTPPPSAPVRKVPVHPRSKAAAARRR